MSDTAISVQLELPDEADTEQLGQLLSSVMHAPLVVYLYGDLGAGKTRLARAVLHGLGHKGNVKSPTYTLVEPYELDDQKVFHFDLYRLADPLELDYMGIRDYFETDCLALIEWPDKGQGVLNPADLIITMSYADPGRKIQIQSQSPRGQECLQKLKQSL